MKAIGTDIVKNDRMSEKLINKFLSSREKDILNSFNEPQLKQEFAAGRWAAKEALIKAFDKSILYSDIEILKYESGKPAVYIKNILDKNVLISISHEKEYSIAVVVIN